MAQPTIFARRTPAGLTLAVVCIAQFMVVLDVSIVNVALPEMKTDLDFTQTGLQWVVNAYTLTFAGFLLLGGRAADLYGRRRLFLAGLMLFAVASLFCGLSQSSGELVTARAFQGLGGAVLSPATLTILTTTFTEPKARVRALGVWSAVAGAGGATGVLAGGVITDLLSWRWVFFINIPIGLFTALAARIVLRESRLEDSRPTLDYAGAFSITAGLSAVVYGIVSTDSHGWGSARVFVPILAGAALIATFALIETRHSHPLVPFRLFRSRALVGANLIMIVVGSVMFSSFYFLAQYAQEVQGYSPLKTGLAFLPMPIAVIVGTQVSSRLATRFGVRRLLIVGTLATAVGMFLISHLGVHTDYLLHFGLPGVLVTFGFGLCLVPATLAATTGVAPADAGLASGLINTTRQIGGSIGLAVLATIASTHTDHLIHESAKAAQTSGYNLAFLWTAGITLVATVIAATVLPRHPPRKNPMPVREKEPEPEPELVLEPA
jgi:EmrB/QacA subfamily drug resistance transporter